MGDSPQRTGPRFDVRVSGDSALHLDVRANPHLFARADLEVLLTSFYDQAHSIARTGRTSTT